MTVRRLAAIVAHALVRAASALKPTHGCYARPSVGSTSQRVERRQECRAQRAPRTLRACATSLAITVITFALSAATTTTWEMNSYQDFLKGRFSGVALDRDGRLTLAPKLVTVFSSGQPAVWSVAQASDGSLYLGTGHRGRVYRISKSGASSLVWTADQPEVFAVAVDPSGMLYAATSPDGKVFRIENGKPVEVFAPKAKYIWTLAFGKDGSLFVGTGDPGTIYRIDTSGKAEPYYETGQACVTSLALDAKGALLAGTEPNGILYRITAKDKAFVLYDANLPEIRSIVPMPDGTIYAAALGGSLANRMAQAPAIATSLGAITVTAPATSITVTDTPTQSGTEIKPKQDTARQAAQAASQPVAQAGAVVEISGVDKSALYKINPDNTVETIWSSKEENVYDLVVHANGEIVFSTDAQGRIYRLSPDRKPALIVQTSEGEATRLIESPTGLLAATGDMGKLLRLDPGNGASGTYEAPIHDAGTVARWGHITWRGSGAKFQTRTGNSLRPDKTWSDWSAPLTSPQVSVIPSPNARYIQWRAELAGPSPTVENVTIAYLPQNTPPLVRSINVTTQVAASGASKTSGSTSAAAYSITVTDTGETSASAGTPTQTVGRTGASQIQIAWQADDPDGDRLVYALYFRGEEESQWKLLRTNMFENSLVLDSDILADGRYYFRVVASDRPSNPLIYAREAELLSSPVLIDNTPPVVTIGAPTRTGDRLEVTVDAVDQTSPLKRCEYSLDAGPWYAVEAVDGVTDSPREQFRITIEHLRAGEHLLVVRAYDTANNPGLAKIVLK
jgi:WD40 repeat protein